MHVKEKVQARARYDTDHVHLNDALQKEIHTAVTNCILAQFVASPELGVERPRPLQVAVGVPGGSQIVGYAIHVGMSADPSCMIMTVQVD
jgi:hypothetical protein